MTSRARSKYRVRVSRTSSASRSSANGVKPTRSANRTLTRRRSATAPATAGAKAGAPAGGAGRAGPGGGAGGGGGGGGPLLDARMVTREYRIAYAAFAPSPRVRSLWLGPHLARFEQDGPLAGRRIEREDVVGLNPDPLPGRRPVRAAVDDEPLVQRVIHDRVVQAGRGAGPEVLAMSGIEAFLQDLPAVRGGGVRDHPAG